MEKKVFSYMNKKSFNVIFAFLYTHLIIIITCNMNIYLHRYVHETREEKAVFFFGGWRVCFCWFSC